MESHRPAALSDTVAVVPISRALDLDLIVAGRPALHWTLSALTAEVVHA